MYEAYDIPLKLSSSVYSLRRIALVSIEQHHPGEHQEHAWHFATMDDLQKFIVKRLIESH